MLIAVCVALEGQAHKETPSACVAQKTRRVQCYFKNKAHVM